MSSFDNKINSAVIPYTYIDDLPQEVLHIILSKVVTESFNIIRLVCQKWNNVFAHLSLVSVITADIPSIIIPKMLTPVKTSLVSLNRLRELKSMNQISEAYDPQTGTDKAIPQMKFVIMLTPIEEEPFSAKKVNEQGWTRGESFATYEETMQYKADRKAEGYTQHTF